MRASVKKLILQTLTKGNDLWNSALNKGFLKLSLVVWEKKLITNKTPSGSKIESGAIINYSAPA